MQVNIVQTFSTTTTSTQTSKSSDTQSKDFNDVLKTEQESSKVENETPKEETAKTEEKSEELEIDASQVLLMPNVQEILNNIKKAQETGEEKLESTELTTAKVSELPVEAEKSNSESEMKILDTSLLKSETEVPKEIMDKVQELVNESKATSDNKTQPSSEEKTQEVKVVNPEVVAVNNTINSEVLVTAKPSIDGMLNTEYVNDINNLISENITAGNNNFTIQLNPENLGTLTIKASFEDGKSIVSIICTDLKTLEAVTKSADDLALIMQNKTGNQTQVVVESPRSDYLDNQSEHNDKNEGQNQQSESKNKDEKENSQDFLQQLRLGLMNF